MEADHFAREQMLANNIPLRHFSNILSRLDNSHSGEADGKEDGETSNSEKVMGYLSSHPLTSERKKQFREEE